MSDYDTNPDAPSMEEIAKQLRHSDRGQRNIVSDADEVIGMSNNCVGLTTTRATARSSSN